jgi:hypothetical protein
MLLFHPHSRARWRVHAARVLLLPPLLPPFNSFVSVVLTEAEKPNTIDAALSRELVSVRRGTASRQSSPTPPPPPPLPRPSLRRAGQAKVRANFAGSVITVAGRLRRSWSSPWPAITGPLSPLFLHSLSFLVSPRSSYRASLRLRWPDLAGAPSSPSAVRHARWWRCFRAPPVSLVAPWCVGGRGEDHDGDLAAGGLAVDERWSCKAAPCAALYDVQGPRVGVPPASAPVEPASWAEPRVGPSRVPG